MSLDELATALEGSFRVSSYENNPAAPHPRLSQYKAKHSGSTQSERRRQQLERQSSKRKDYSNHIRRLVSGFTKEEELSEDEEDEEMDVSENKSSPDHWRECKREYFYANQLMLSEWLVEVPTDFTTEWYAVPCPVGKRCLVVTSRGRTNVYNKGGHFISSFQSLLPGGSNLDYSSAASTILDVVMCEVGGSTVYYILDVMCWNSHPVYDSETEFRFYWKLSKLEDIEPAISEPSTPFNKYGFVALKHYECDTASLEAMMAEKAVTHTPETDGILFYHKHAHYKFGATPLVLWLKGYMMPEILNVSVPKAVLAKAPSSYTGFENHLNIVRNDRQWTEEREERKRKAKEQKKKRNSANKNNSKDESIDMTSTKDDSVDEKDESFDDIVVDKFTDSINIDEPAVGGSVEQTVVT